MRSQEFLSRQFLRGYAKSEIGSSFPHLPVKASLQPRRLFAGNGQPFGGASLLDHAYLVHVDEIDGLWMH